MIDMSPMALKCMSPTALLMPPKALLSLLSSFVFFYGYEFYKKMLRKARVPLSAVVNVLVAST